MHTTFQAHADLFLLSTLHQTFQLIFKILKDLSISRSTLSNSSSGVICWSEKIGPRAHLRSTVVVDIRACVGDAAWRFWCIDRLKERGHLCSRPFVRQSSMIMMHRRAIFCFLVLFVSFATRANCVETEESKAVAKPRLFVNGNGGDHQNAYNFVTNPRNSAYFITQFWMAVSLTPYNTKNSHCKLY